MHETDGRGRGGGLIEHKRHRSQKFVVDERRGPRAAMEAVLGRR